MKNVQKPVRTAVSAIVIASMFTSVASAGSFSLYTEGTGSAEGNYAAGIAAEAANASTGWYNPAGLALLHNQQFVFSGIGVFPNSNLNGSSSFTTPPAPPYIQTFNNLKGGKSAVVPSFHYARPLGENATFGLSLVSPFGLSTNWGPAAPVRYEATKSQLTTIDLSPEIGGRITEYFALGAGLDLQYARVTFDSVLGNPPFVTALNAIPLFAGLPPTAFDSASANKGSSFAVGFHTGGMLILNDNHSRIGLNYQSKVKHKFHGYSQLKGPLASPTFSPLTITNDAIFRSDHLSSNNIEFPDVVTLSGYHDVNDTLALLGSVVYTGWRSLKTIELDKVAAYVTGVGPALVDAVTVENYKNTWRFALGANYKVNTQWMMRVGGGYDQTPTTNQNRDVRVADTNRWALSVGTHYQMRPNISADFGYTHLFETSPSLVNKTTTLGTSTYVVNAIAKGSADLVGFQLNWMMDTVETPVMTK